MDGLDGTTCVFRSEVHTTASSNYSRVETSFLSTVWLQNVKPTREVLHTEESAIEMNLRVHRFLGHPILPTANILTSVPGNCVSCKWLAVCLPGLIVPSLGGSFEANSSIRENCYNASNCELVLKQVQVSATLLD